MESAKKKRKAKQKESSYQPLSSSAEPELIQKPKRFKLTPNPPPSQPPEKHTQSFNIGPLPNSVPIQSTEEALVAELRIMTPSERAEFRGEVKGTQKQHRAGVFWNRPGPSPLRSGLTNIRSPSKPPRVGNGSRSVLNFGPFSPSVSSDDQESGSDSKASIIKIRIIPPKPIPQTKPKSKPVNRGLLLPYQFTYLRPRPTHRTPDPNSNTTALMGPPEPRNNIDTPYETVKKALTFLKSELKLTTYPNLTYSVSKISRNLCSTVEDVIMELDEFVFSIAKTSSSDEMKALLMLFQRGLGLPAWPPFYNMLWFSPPDLLDHLADNFVSDRVHDDF